MCRATICSSLFLSLSLSASKSWNDLVYWYRISRRRYTRTPEHCIAIAPSPRAATCRCHYCWVRWRLGRALLSADSEISREVQIIVRCVKTDVFEGAVGGRRTREIRATPHGSVKRRRFAQLNCRYSRVLTSPPDDSRGSGVYR